MNVEMLPIPLPYRACLAICSDLDETADRHIYYEIARFLNTREETRMGPGVGLEVGNSIYFDMPSNQFSYWNTDDAGREMICSLICSGHVDCLHSYGDLAATRAHAGRALDELDRRGCRLRVWVDHAVAPTNLGSDIMKGWGDVPGHPAYHADLTCGHGIEFLWRGRVTSVIGQGVRRRLLGIFTLQHPIGSLRTIMKETIKGWCGRLGVHRYAPHGFNPVLWNVTLRDGRAALEFLRCNPSWAGVSGHDTGQELGHVLTRKFLDRLVDRNGFCILYTHLGKRASGNSPLPVQTVDALRLLAEYQESGKILVTTTARLLAYQRAVRELRASLVNQKGDGAVLHVEYEGDAKDLQGVTLHTQGVSVRDVFLNGCRADLLVAHPVQGGACWQFPWERLTFPSL